MLVVCLVENTKDVGKKERMLLLRTLMMKKQIAQRLRVLTRPQTGLYS